MRIQNAINLKVRKQTKLRGKDYFLRGRVQPLEVSEDLFKAVVQGTKKYQVELEFIEDGLEISCTCPYFLDNGVCKHIWAAILKAEQDSEALKDLEGLTGIELYPLDPREGDGEYFEDYEDEFSLDGSFSPDSVGGRTPSWKEQINIINKGMSQELIFEQSDEREFYYILDPYEILDREGGMVVSIQFRNRHKDGRWGKIRKNQIIKYWNETSEPDRKILANLKSFGKALSFQWKVSYTDHSMSDKLVLSEEVFRFLMPQLCATGRFRIIKGKSSFSDIPLAMDVEEPYKFEMLVQLTENQYELRGLFRRGDKVIDLADPNLIMQYGLFFHKNKIKSFSNINMFPWILLLRPSGSLKVPKVEGEVLVEKLLLNPSLPKVTIPKELQVKEIQSRPCPCLAIKNAEQLTTKKDWLAGELTFDYDGNKINPLSAAGGIMKKKEKIVIRRDLSFEKKALAQLAEAGFQWTNSYFGGEFLGLPAKNLNRVVATLLLQGWRIEAQGKLYRTSSKFEMKVSSGVDWFELHGGCSFEGEFVPFPELLTAVKKGESLIRLGDGSFGVLPEEWLEKFSGLAGLGEKKKDHLRFQKSQAMFLDALLASQPEASCDDVFRNFQKEIHSFKSVDPKNPPEGFSGKLRDYQKIGLGWFDFLRRFSFGGCLADDMGLGKTIQVLALLADEKLKASASKNEKDKEGNNPLSLIVVPKSLIFNWMQEAKRFTPELRFFNHTGTDRCREGSKFSKVDVVLTTYGTLRNDIELFRSIPFHYLILDESQAIKNANTASAKAVRLLQGKHRLALSGTPIENHLGELWSLFEFLNPGMLGSASVFQMTGAASKKPDAQVGELLAKALRPFILRRTKDQVASELPEKMEQTIYCELEGQQRKQYNELRDHYRELLQSKINGGGLNKIKIQVLEALLRLRQAACHVGLIDKSKENHSSAKLDLLIAQLEEIVQEGKKALVFSQFTSLLSLVRKQLDKKKIKYAYLDGKTRDRAERVEAFQNDPDCRLFLISLKAGGVGLNLTAAEYVFLLDPWWNPAVEAQAIDRTHRIGQTQKVFAYRIIAKDTVEEKVLELQKKKRNLAEAIINQDNSLIRNLTKEDLMLLLS